MTQTILLTGASGYIAKHIAARLLNAGYAVRGTVRSLDRGDEVRAAVLPELTDPSRAEALSFVALDLTRDEGWPEAMEGIDVLMHTASPFPMSQPKDEDDLIRPAVDGALRALRAAHAAGVTRVILTSSVAAVAGPGGKSTPYDESDWTDPTHPEVPAYSRSKTLAEKAAWDYVEKEAPEIRLTTINPVLVIGPPLDRHFGTSIQLVERVLKAKDPMIPDFGFSCVDVRDVADMHVAALETLESEDQRLIASERFMWFADMAQMLKSEFPNRKIVTRKAPNIVMRFLGLFDPSIRQLVPALGRKDDVSAAKARSVFGMTFRDTRESLTETASYLIENKLV